MREKRSIVRDIVRDCAILHQTKYLVSHSLSKKTFNSSSRTFSFAITLSNSSCNGQFTSRFYFSCFSSYSLKCRTYFKLILCLLKLSHEQKTNTRCDRPSFLYFGSVFNKTIIPLALVGYEMIIANSALRASLAIYHLLVNSQLRLLHF